MTKPLSNYQILKEMIANACIKGKDSLNLTNEQVESAIGDVKENLFEILGYVEN